VLKVPFFLKVSNDSDFFINDVNFVALDSMLSAEANEDGDGLKHLQCVRFNRQAFMDKYGEKSLYNYLRDILP
jgi:hypothetical protein